MQIGEGEDEHFGSWKKKDDADKILFMRFQFESDHRILWVGSVL